MSVHAPEHLMLTAALSALAGCAEADLPPRFSDADAIEVKQTRCSGDVGPEGPASAVAVTDVDARSGLHGKATEVPFRCGQDVCGYAQADDATADVLLQPCDMKPESVARCDCLYGFTFEVPAPDAERLVVWRRTDEHAGDSELSRVGEAPVPLF